MSVSDCSQKAIANLGMDDVKFPSQYFMGYNYGFQSFRKENQNKGKVKGNLG
ncbi:MAG: hypothetical protein CM15mP109_10550 [Candidatus Dadabacteria bacterium]|nr:MAG: hypothetical protein CM15mP109_10550 [Candidatus Dadabacteria bacterium]